jgi:hypothetical protein
MAIGQTPQLKASMFGRTPVGGAKTPTGGGLPVAKGPKGVPLEARVGIQAPAHVIWDVLYDLDSWSQWNPMYPKAAGAIRIGETLKLTVAVPGQPPQEIAPTVLEWVPNEQLHWKLSMLGGFIKSTRFIEIETLADESCIVSNGELFSGLMGPSLAKRMGGSITRGFREMNEALKARAELLWQRRKP